MIFSTLKKIVLGVTFSIATLSSYAAGLQINPIGLTLAPNERAGVFNLTNISNEPMTVQVRVYRWEQDDKGKEVLTPTNDVLASPPMVQLGAKDVQQFRVIRAKPASSKEETYRLLIDELPSVNKKASKNLQFVLRYSVPVFLNQVENPEPTLEWQAQQGVKGQTLLTVRNVGNAYAQISNMKLVDTASKQDRQLIEGLGGYVLAQKTVQYQLPVPVATLQKNTLSVTVNGRTIKPEVRFVKP